MLKPADTSKKPAPRPPRADCCPESECVTGLRNNYYVGKRLTPDALSIEQRYLNRRRQLLNRAIHGVGVVCGYAVEHAPTDLSRRQTEPSTLWIGDGLALDDLGRELVSVEPLALRLADFIVLEAPGRRMSLCKGEIPWGRSECWRLRVHYAERPVDEVTLNDPCSCERQAWDRVCETVRFSLEPLDCAECCPEPECALKCGCPDPKSCCADRLLKEYGLRAAPAEIPAGQRAALESKEGVNDLDRARIRQPKVVPRGGCECLCHRELDLGAADCARLTEVSEVCGKVRVDLCHGVTLACVHIEQDRCEDWVFGAVEACAVRAVVKSNDVLFDLIRGCDLTRIVDARWLRLDRRHEPVKWLEFAESFKPGSEELGYRGYHVRFSRRVLVSTLQPDSFAISVVLVDETTGWGNVRRVPIIDIEPDGEDPDFTEGATLVIDGFWYGDEVHGPWRAFNCEEFVVEVEVRGERIIDCNGLAIDASGSGTPGTRWTVPIRVQGPEHPEHGRRPWIKGGAEHAEPGQSQEGASS